jgi:hypothetical protein
VYFLLQARVFRCSGNVGFCVSECVLNRLAMIPFLGWFGFQCPANATQSTCFLDFIPLQCMHSVTPRDWPRKFPQRCDPGGHCFLLPLHLGALTGLGLVISWIAVVAVMNKCTYTCLLRNAMRLRLQRSGSRASIPSSTHTSL